MSRSQRLEDILVEAVEKEKTYDWQEAANFYGQVLNSVVKEDSLKKGEIHERSGYAFYRAAMQAESVDEFKDKMHQAMENYREAEIFYENSHELSVKPRTSRCKAMIAYIRYWLASEASEKKRLIDECWEFTKQSLRTFEEAGEASEYGKTFNQLAHSALFGFLMEWNYQVRERIIKEAMERGERAITFLSASEEPQDLATVYARNALTRGIFAYNFLDIEGREKDYDRIAGYVAKAKELDEQTATLELLFPAFGPNLIFGVEGTDEALTNYKRALEFAKKTRDKFMIGCALDWLTYHVSWKLIGTEDPDEALSLANLAFQHGEEAKRQFHQICFISPRGDCYWIESLCEYHLKLTDLETDLKKKHVLIKKAVEEATQMLETAEKSGYPEIVLHAHHELSYVLASLSTIAKSLEEKKELLDRALEHRNENIKITEQIMPLMYWNHGVTFGGLAKIKYILAELTENRNNKKTLLEEAVHDTEKAFEFLYKDLAFYEGKGSSAALLAILAGGYSGYGILLSHLYDITGDKGHINKALEAFDNAIKTFQKLNQMARTAEGYWKVARVLDNLGQHQEASENFDLAAADYKKAARNMPQLKGFYEDHALYMQAWSEIERARHHHKRQEYGLAEEHFEKAAELHKSLKKWDYLAPNYFAWAKIELAEDLSRKEQNEEALKTFKHAAKLFIETKETVQARLKDIESREERQMATKILETSDLWHRYSNARVSLEDARIQDKKGDHSSSSEKYGLAAEDLEGIIDALDSEQERKEFKFIICFSRAWQKMTCAEAEASPSFYAEAAQLFEDAKEFGSSEKSRMLALGHSRFCKALEAGTRFTDTLDKALHATAAKYLESAANYYVKADFREASEYAKATGLLFDAYVQVDYAKGESDPEKKAKLYMVAEKLLQTSAGLFMKAEHPEKREQVLRMLEKIREERELAISLSEVFHAPLLVSATTAIAAPASLHEEAVGLERFEEAEIQANMVVRRKEVYVGDDLDVEIELVNAGKGPAVLVKIADVIPEGFELTEKPLNYRVEDSYVNMKGKRLSPLKSEEVKLVLKPKVRGVFSLKPRVLYLDENGKYKSHESEAVTVTVKELGIKSWLSGKK